jgi:hypothetical protein
MFVFKQLIPFFVKQPVDISIVNIALQLYKHKVFWYYGTALAK